MSPPKRRRRMHTHGTRTRANRQGLSHAFAIRGQAIEAFQICCGRRSEITERALAVVAAVSLAAGEATPANDTT